MDLNLFNYSIEPDRIAQFPILPRTEARVIVRDFAGNLHHTKMLSISEHVPRGSLIVFNNTKVFACRLIGTIKDKNLQKHIRKCELFLLECPQSKSERSCVAKAIGYPMRLLEPDTLIHVRDNVTIKILDRCEEASVPTLLVEINLPEKEIFDWLDQNAMIPLPPYIKRVLPKVASDSEDRDLYQTAFASVVGSVAAPTAGLHFDTNLLQDLQEQHQCEIEYVTLHIGAGTFLPIRTENIQNHKLHSESYHISQSTWKKIQQAIAQDQPIIVVGTTTLRTLESFSRLPPEQQKHAWQTTNLFIKPPSIHEKVKLAFPATALMTNFHQPESSLFILVCGLIGINAAQKLYSEALRESYRFFSYGDASLLYLK